MKISLRHFVERYAVRNLAGKIPVYTVNFGGYDRMHKAPSSDKYKFFVFTDKSYSFTTVDGWSIVNVPTGVFSSIALARSFKVLGHLLFPETGPLFYIDSSFMLLDCLILFLDSLLGSELVFFDHPCRKTVRSEIMACLSVGKLELDFDVSNLDGLADFLRFHDNHLFASGFMFRSLYSPDVVRLMEYWYKCIMSLTWRDQITLPFALHSCNIKPSSVGASIYLNPYLVPSPHIGSPFLHRLKWVFKACLLKCFSLFLCHFRNFLNLF